jgi:DNA repair protein RecO (recombination protein O)
VTRTGTTTQTTDNEQTEEQTQPPPRLNTKLDAIELTLLQKLAEAELPDLSTMLPAQVASLSPLESFEPVWVKVERILRDYAQYHFGRSIRSAVLVDALSIPDF